ncbi:parallel beta helix pectate lyase-like protein [Roseimicrobium gellanilyticum]|uniref:Parallel beta helix pectate lyase-like protein n=1 Tax=Roseimicrobium gellanilyticum TaxID=748857 RepID=A0A366HLL5_9BACT|nr:right-handed parallel beta-helix repeat-containing protein [Roseimicrobium gellanilyticum]RBP43828.1 parallel beta helix pectate lyase-like protein [Roseimicrobium gellanilyticum]
MSSLPALHLSPGSLFSTFRCLIVGALLVSGGLELHAQSPSVAEYKSIQEALDANPGKMVYLPQGDHVVSERITLKHDGSGLYGYGRIVQENAEQPVIRADGRKRIILRDITLTRAEGKQESRAEGVYLNQCEDVLLENVRVMANRSPAASISVRDGKATQIRGCAVENYMRISIDDRTQSENYGYAFRCIDGTGIAVVNSEGNLIQNCRVVEHVFVPTQALKEKHGLGKFTKKNAERGKLMNPEVWNAEYVNNWHQGSGIIVTGPEISARTQLIGNQIENAAQGIDLHCDQVVVSNNIVNNAFIGMKAMHGARHVLIIGNQFIKNDLWSIGLMPGAASHHAEPATTDRPALAPNVDGGSIIANNIISDFGHGSASWMWMESGSCNPLRFDKGQTPQNPPLTDVLIQGNVIYDSGKDSPLVDGVPKKEGPRYSYAVRIETDGKNPPQGLHFSNNILHPGSKGVSNVDLPP